MMRVGAGSPVAVGLHITRGEPLCDVCVSAERFRVMEQLEMERFAPSSVTRRPPVAEPDNHHNADVCPFCKRNRDERETAIRAEANRLVNEYAVKAGNLALALEAAQRPPASPEVREVLADVVSSAMIRAKTDTPYGVTDALLARFSFPTLDPEKVARVLAALLDASMDGTPLTSADGCEPTDVDRRIAEDLIARLPSLVVGA